MVKLLRVDERLLHGQVAVSWVGKVGASNILIANDELMTNDMGRMAVKMAKPNGVRLAIRSMDDAIALLNDPRSESLAVFAIVRTVGDALRLVKETSGIQTVNIGGIKKKEGGKLIQPACYVTDADIEILKELDTLVENLEFRTMSTAAPRTLKAVLSGIN